MVGAGGAGATGTMTNLLALQPGTELVSDYRIERVLGAGGFGITYLAEELALGRHVTIKEYFPSDFAARDGGVEALPRSQDCDGDYQWGLDRFIEEAQTLARFDHKNIVRVYRYFRTNNTAYMVLSFEEGQSFKGWLKSLGRAPRQKEIDAILPPLLDALELVHKEDYLHRDIAPDNIIIRADGSPVLIDFGAARGEIAAHSRTVSALVKPGYSPYEQYAERSSQQGPWTDIYALGATLYSAVTGKRPPDAPSRIVKDELVPTRDSALAAYRRGFLDAIDKSLALNIEARPQSVSAWRGDLLAPDPPKPGWFQRAADKRRERTQAEKIPVAAGGAGNASATVPLPPPPDAPAPQGVMLDFIEGLKPAADRALPPAARAAPLRSPAEAQLASRPEAPAQAIPKPTSKAQPALTERLPTAAAATEILPLPVKALPAAKPKAAKPARAPRPRAVRKAGAKRRWLPLLVKLAIGAGVAAAAVELRESLGTQLETHGGATLASERATTLPGRQLKGHQGPVRALALADAGRTIVSIGEDQTLRVWDVAGARLVRTIELDHGVPTALAVAGRQALTAHTQGIVALWDLDRGTRLNTYKRNNADIWSLAFLPDGKTFIAGAHDWSIAIWKLDTPGDPRLVFDSHENAVQAIAAARDGTHIASGSADKHVKLWDVAQPGLVRTYRGHRDFVTALAFRPNGQSLASAALDGTVRIWSTSSSRLQRSLDRHRGRVTALAWSPNSEWLASSGEDGLIRIYDARRGRSVRTLPGHDGPVRAVTFTPDARHLVSAGDDGTIRIWNMETAAARDD